MATNNNRSRQNNNNNSSRSANNNTRQSANANNKSILCGGYDAIFEPGLDKKYMCPVCLAGLKKPVQTKCGHRFCKTCMKQLAGTRSFAKCPVDKTWLDVKGNVFEDLAVEREVLSLTVRCKNQERGCQWRGELRHLKLHSDKCQYSTLICPYGCGETYLRQNNDDHLKDCPLRLVDCQYCKEKIAHTDTTRHEFLVCPRFPITCGVCGKNNIPREDIPQHTDIKDGDCPNIIVPCSFESVGCKAKIRRCDIASHNQGFTVQHLESMMLQVNSQQSVLRQQEKTLKESQDDCSRLRSEHSDLTRKLDEKDNQLKQQLEKITELENTSYNGRLHWKVKIPKGNAQNGRSQCIMSPPFYTGCPGYKLRACLELKGHKSGDTFFSSINVVLCQGKYDDNLHFPFSSNCAITLFDQSNNHKGRHNFATSFACNNMPRAETDGNRNQKRGRLSFMKMDTLTKGRFCVGGSLFMQIDIMQATPHSAIAESSNMDS